MESTELTSKIKKLPPEERRRFFAWAEFYIKQVEEALEERKEREQLSSSQSG